jgi:shikimate kinase
MTGGQQAPGRAERVVLVGGMGTGKTVVGAALARRIGWRHLDLDALVERSAGRRIAEIFESEGEPAFRHLEADATRSVASARRVVVSTGGGWVMNAESVALLRPSALFVWLRASAETVLGRFAGKDLARRPLLAAGDPESTLRRLAREREPMYRTADIVVDVDGRAVHDIVEEILTEVRPVAGAGPIP